MDHFQALDGQVQRPPRDLDGTLGFDSLNRSQPSPSSDLNGRGHLCIRTLNGLFPLGGLVEQVLEVGLATLEGSRIHIRQIVRDDLVEEV